MGIASLTFSDLLADLWTPLQSLAGRWLPSHAGTRKRKTGALRYVAVRPPRTLRSSSAPPLPRPLRVVRVVDPMEPGARSGRVVISGRMADVCAELDRLAALESAETAFSHKRLH